MLRNYLKIALRRMRREPVFATINIAGMALGLTVCILIGLFIYHEFSYDRFHEKSDRIYRVLMEYTTEDENRTFAITPVPLATAVQQTYPEVQKAVRIEEKTGIIQHEGQAFEETVLFVDSTFLDILDFPLEHGDQGAVLRDPNTVVLSRGAARRYFGHTDVVGQSLSIDVGEYGNLTFTVGGVTRPLPETSSLQFGVLLPISRLAGLDRTFQNPHWRGASVVTYVQLREDAETKGLEAAFSKLLTERGPQAKAPPGERKMRKEIHLEPLTDVHFSPGLYGSLQPGTKRIYSYILGGVGVFILLIAGINFMTLATARSARRTSEIGVRKVVGARRTQLMGQFWGEAIMTTAISAIAALLLARLLLPVFGHVVGEELSFTAMSDPYVLVGLAATAAFVGLIAGSYPAFYLSGFRPIRAFTSDQSPGQKHWLFRGLITLQFSLAIGLIIGTIIMSSQLGHLQNRNLGFNEEQIVCLDVAKYREGQEVLERYRTALAKEPEILSLGGSWDTIGGTAADAGFVGTTPLTSEGQEVRVRALGVAANTIKTLGVKLLRGRGFRPGETELEKTGVLVNESAVRAFGWKDPLKHSVGLVSNKTVPVIGVVEDFHYRSLHHPIQPLMIQPTGALRTIYVRIQSGSPTQTLDLLQNTWQEAVPDQPFSYTFLDQRIDQQYQSERQWARIITYAAVFAIGIACMGLFGLAMLAATRRTREIGIRKVLGASAASIVGLLSRDFLKLVLLSFAVAAPIAYVGAQRWLDNFAYRIDLGPTIFLAAGLLALLVAFLTVSYQAIKAALTNPADSLRYE